MMGDFAYLCFVVDNVDDVDNVGNVDLVDTVDKKNVAVYPVHNVTK